jgi:hypothetical protein
MSSLQTMTAPAVGHRPPDPAPDVSLNDFGPVESEPKAASSPDSSAMRDEQRSDEMKPEAAQDAPDSATGTANQINLVHYC